MLPNKMKISEKAFNSLRRLQNNTGLTINIGARLAFFISFEQGFVYNGDEITPKARELDKHTWLGDYTSVVELLLKNKYESLSDINFYRAWVAHVEYGSKLLESKRLSSLIHIN